MAKQTVGCLLSPGLLRCDPGQDSRRRLRSQQAIYIALGILPDGTKEILGIWIEQRELRERTAF